MSYTVVRHTIHRETVADTDVHDLTDEIASLVTQSRITAGQCLVFVAGATASVSTIEYEAGCIEDIARVLDEIAPSDAYYKHNERWGDGNGFSHVRATLMKPGITVPVADNALVLGTWQQIILLDFDNRPRRREVQVQISGLAG